jgi:hypothetical protein
MTHTCYMHMLQQHVNMYMNMHVVVCCCAYMHVHVTGESVSTVGADMRELICVS